MAYVVAFPRTSPAELHSTTLKNVPVTSSEQQTESGRTSQPYQQTAAALKRMLPQTFHFLIHPPFVMTGDLPLNRLQALHSQIVDPVSRALQSTYFQHTPKQPISIVICSTEAEFRRLAREWDGHTEAGYHGYYQRDKRRILLDLQAGYGSLAHELTHALTQADCEHLPEWFDEGLGALHEDATLTANNKGLIGLPNWRCRVTQQALQSGQLPSLLDLTEPNRFRTGHVEVRYAMARSLCLFLQDERLLVPFYKALRKRPQDDLSGLKTLCQILHVADVNAAEERLLTALKRSGATKKRLKTRSDPKRES